MATIEKQIKNPYVVINGVHREAGKHMVNYKIVIPRENGQSELKGNAVIGWPIEIPITEEPDDPNDDNPLREVERKNVRATL